MDDLEFRRKLYADPGCQDEDIARALADDPNKQQFAENLKHFDSALKETMQVDVPDGLAERLILRQSVQSHQQQKRKGRVQLALAASVAFIVGLSVNLMNSSPAYRSLSDHALAHIYHEEGYIASKTGEVSLQQVNARLDDYGAKFVKLPAKMKFAGFCQFDGVTSLHLAMQGEKGEVTIFVIPAEAELDFVENFADGRYQGVAEQFTHAQMVIIGKQDESLSKIKADINANMTWSI